MTYELIIGHPIFKGALAGLLVAATVDRQAFRSWQSFDDAKKYAWSIAIWRWFQGVVIGAMTGAGLAL